MKLLLTTFSKGTRSMKYVVKSVELFKEVDGILLSKHTDPENIIVRLQGIIL